MKWIIKKPWVLEGNDPDKRYPFSSSAVIFIYFRVKIYHINDELECSSMLLLRNGHLKILYLYSHKNPEHFVDFLSGYIVKNKIKMLTSYQSQLNKTIKSKSNFPNNYERNLERNYMFHKTFLQNLPADFSFEFRTVTETVQ